MFKYGTLKLFFAKIFIGAILIFFSLVLFVSLLSFNIEDPGFKKIADEQNIHNYLGYFGAKLSSFMLVFWGHASYIISLFAVHDSWFCLHQLLVCTKVVFPVCTFTIPGVCSTSSLTPFNMGPIGKASASINPPGKKRQEIPNKIMINLIFIQLLV